MSIYSDNFKNLYNSYICIINIFRHTYMYTTHESNGQLIPCDMNVAQTHSISLGIGAGYDVDVEKGTQNLRGNH